MRATGIFASQGWRFWATVCAAVALAIGGAAWIARGALAEQHAAFETDARIAHRVLSQRVVQHDAVLATLALLQPASAGEGGPEQRLPALYPQVLRVLRRDADAPWPLAGAEGEALGAAEALSRRERRAALGAVDFAQGRYWLVHAAAPASFALLIDMRSLVVPADWPLTPGAPVRALLAHGGREQVLQAGAPDAIERAPWRFVFAKVLASESQPFEVRLAAGVGWGALPWGAIAAWAAAVAALLAAAGAAWRQRAAQRRSSELLRLGQVGRLNALGELAAGIAHELNQPLTAVLANTGAAERLLADDEPDLPRARQAMSGAAQQARRAADVLSRLRRLIERPEAAAPAQALRVAAQLERALDLHEPELRRLGVRPVVDVQPPALALRAEPVAFEQILHNLLGNALHALKRVPAAERRLELVARAEGGRVRLTVRDSGPGIPAEVLPRLFEPFFTTRAGQGGLGLGLSLAETLALAMDGALVGGNALPRGAEFHLDLPPAEAAP
jgi:signal transduction histidine kinase